MWPTPMWTVIGLFSIYHQKFVFMKKLANLAEEFKEGIDKKTNELKSQPQSLPQTTVVHRLTRYYLNCNQRDISNISQDEINAICTLSAVEESELETLRAKNANS